MWQPLIRGSVAVIAHAFAGYPAPLFVIGNAGRRRATAARGNRRHRTRVDAIESRIGGAHFHVDAGRTGRVLFRGTWRPVPTVREMPPYNDDLHDASAKVAKS